MHVYKLERSDLALLSSEVYAAELNAQPIYAAWDGGLKVKRRGWTPPMGTPAPEYADAAAPSAEHVQQLVQAATAASGSDQYDCPDPEQYAQALADALEAALDLLQEYGVWVDRG